MRSSRQRQPSGPNFEVGGGNLAQVDLFDVGQEVSSDYVTGLVTVSQIVDVPLEGEIKVPGISKTDDELSTLDEPVKETILRDLKAVGKKFLHVLIPKRSKLLLKEWDLWGPLVLCTFLAIMLQGSSNDFDQMNQNDGGPQFAEVFVIYWLGASVVTLNIKLLGGNISFFQSICVLGYCVCPLAVALIICRILLTISTESTAVFVVRFLCVVGGFGWSTFASTAFLHESQPSGRKALAMTNTGLMCTILLLIFFLSVTIPVHHCYIFYLSACHDDLTSCLFFLSVFFYLWVK
ncbi:Yip1 member 6 [Bulinus truncatus]|nr:Yip1 member 6 [Bulinus truncatus]